MDLYRPYVDGLENLPPDGRFLLVGNHTQAALGEIVLIPYFVRSAIGARVRPLADRQFSQIRGPQAALINAYGAVVGTPENASELMRSNQTVLVFPGGGREMPKFKGEEYTLRWDNRYGFARLAVEHGYPIVVAGLVGSDDVYTSITTRDSRWGPFSEWLGERVSGRARHGHPPHPRYRADADPATPAHVPSLQPAHRHDPPRPDVRGELGGHHQAASAGRTRNDAGRAATRPRR